MRSTTSIVATACETHPRGHAIPHAEVERRKLDAVVYREYLDPAFTIPNTAPIVSADINEPRYERRVPGAVLYAEPGERLFIHVLNADDHPHSFHIHGLVYGIDSDGSWPFGVADADGRRSDAICPGDEWCYTFDVTEETIGAWPFHDHYADIFDHVNLGLFGGLIVRDPRCPEPDLEVPFFLHRLSASGHGHGAGHAEAGFDSGTLSPGGTFAHTFPDGERSSTSAASTRCRASCASPPVDPPPPASRSRTVPGGTTPMT